MDAAVASSLAAPQYGARGVQRSVRRLIAIPLAKLVLMHGLDGGATPQPSQQDKLGEAPLYQTEQQELAVSMVAGHHEVRSLRVVLLPAGEELLFERAQL